MSDETPQIAPLAKMDWDHTCLECGGQAGDTDTNGHIVHGGYGSSRYDTTLLIWLSDAGKNAQKGYLCDDCIDRHVEAGELEAFSTHFGELPEGSPSQAAYHALFAYYAQRVADAYWDENGDRRYDGRPLDEAGHESIERLRATMVGRDSSQYTSMVPTPRQELADRAIRVGECHALAAIALGYGQEDPNFEKAAARWAEKRATVDAELHDLRNMFSNIDANTLFDDADGKAEEAPN
jgi:hypothetical protein